MLEINKVHQGDCLALLPLIEDNSIDAIIVDPPYYKVKKEKWDNQWLTVAEFLSWMGLCLVEFHRVLKSNGSYYSFASPAMAARAEVLTGEYFNVLNHIVWEKEKDRGKHAASCKDTLRTYFPNTERIIFAEHYNADNAAKGEAGYVAKCDELRGFVFEPLRAYLDGERLRAGVSQRQVIAHLGMKGHDPHFFKAVQWKLPLASQYQAMRELFNLDKSGEYLRREYEELRREYEELRREYEELRRPFNAHKDAPYTDVWNFPTVRTYKNKHPCEKPQALLKHMINMSTHPGMLILDSFCGTGSLGLACQATGRNFILIEKEKEYVEIARNRIAMTTENLF